ncbi:MAG: hypothetical protein ABIJ17_03205 [Patescibacteria group bacterium]
MSLTLEERKQKVLNYLDKHATSNLVFTNAMNDYIYLKHKYLYIFIETPEFNNIKELSKKNAVKEVLELSQNYYSKYENRKRIQCKREANRSATDLWRHLKHFRNDISIFDVMTYLYELNINNECTSQYCCTVLKRVFSLGRGAYNSRNKDEFGLTLFDWKDINQGEKNEN